MSPYRPYPEPDPRDQRIRDLEAELTGLKSEFDFLCDKVTEKVEEIYVLEHNRDESIACVFFLILGFFLALFLTL